MVRCYLPNDEVAPTSWTTDLYLSIGSGYYGKIDGGGIRGLGDNAHNCGNATYRWALVRGVTITSGDLGFEETACLKCEKPFVDGDVLVLLVKGLSDWGGTLTIPIHLKCTQDPPVIRKVKPPKFEYKYAFVRGQKILEQVPVMQVKTVKQRQVKQIYGQDIAWFDRDTGAWKRKNFAIIPDFLLGDEIPDSDALEEKDIEIEEMVYEEKEIEI